MLYAFLHAGTPVVYEEALSPDYTEGLDFLREHRQMFDRYLGDDPKQKALMVSVVFPEIVRYSFVRDLLETRTLEVAYTLKGSDLVDFSIGRFQMKPSFVESMEASVKQSSRLSGKYADILDYPKAEEALVRRTRINRLKSLDWQLRYLRVFCDLVAAAHPFLKDQSFDYRVKFFATAYNHSFHANKEELERWMHKKTYPYGVGVKGEQYAYSRVALYFAQHHYSTLF